MQPVNKTQLVRGLSLIAAVSIVVGNVIGTGVFLKARVMTCNVGTPGKVLGVYVIAGCLSLAGALSYAELAAMMPRAGGEYVFMREAYGRPWGFLFGWMSFFIGKAGSQAALGVQFALFLNAMLRGALGGEFFSKNIFGYTVPFGKIQVAALLSILIVTGINCLAVKVSGDVATVLSAIKIALVLVIGIGAFLLASGADWSHLWMSNGGGSCEGVSAAARVGFGGFIAAMLGGWRDAADHGVISLRKPGLFLRSFADRDCQRLDQVFGCDGSGPAISRSASSKSYCGSLTFVHLRHPAHFHSYRRARAVRDGPR